MFSYFSSSAADDETEKPTAIDGVAAIGTAVTENSNISEDESGYNNPIAAMNNGYQSRIPSKPVVGISWRQSHDIYCSKHGTLKASMHEILSEICGENQEIPWALPRESDANVLVESKQVVEILQTKRVKKSTTSTTSTPMKSTISSLLMSPIKVVSAVASMMRDPDDDIDEWIQDGDDAFIDDEGNVGNSSSSAFGLHTPLINLNTTEAAIECLERKIDQIPPETPLVMGLSEWSSWAQSAFSNSIAGNQFNFSIHDNDFLLQVLVDLNRAKIVRRENSKPKGIDVVVLTFKTIKDEKDGSLPENLRIAVSLWDIQRAEEMIEQKLQEWSEQAAECTRKALMYKKRNQPKLATTQIAKRRMIQQRIDSDSRLQLQLLQTKNAIESAQSNRSMVDLMADSANMLRQLREATPLDEVDETVDGLQAELDGLQDINDTIASVGNNVTNACTDDELLAELENLSINDSNPHTSASDSSTGTTPAKKTDPPKIATTPPKPSQEIKSDVAHTPKRVPELA